MSTDRFAELKIRCNQQLHEKWAVNCAGVVDTPRHSFVCATPVREYGSSTWAIRVGDSKLPNILIRDQYFGFEKAVLGLCDFDCLS